MPIQTFASSPVDNMKDQLPKFELKGNQILDLCSIQIPGERIILTSITDQYAADIFKHFTTEVTRYMIPSPADDILETKAFISQSILGMKEGRDIVLIITHSETGEFLGCCGLHGKSGIKTPELGIWLKQPAHGHHYGLEAIRVLVEWSFCNLYLDYLIYPVDRANRASRNIPETLGGRVFLEKKVRQMSGSYLDELCYKLLPPD